MADQAGGFLSPWLRQKRINAVLPYLRGKVLDVGCGVGKLSTFCKNDIYFGVDLDIESINLAKNRHPGFRFSNNYPVGELFDTIVMLAVIEHIPEPESFLNNLLHFLNFDGQMVITTPPPFIEKYHKFGARLGLFSNDAAEEHVSLIDRVQMERIAAKGRLSIKEYRRFFLNMNQLFVLKRQ